MVDLSTHYQVEVDSRHRVTVDFYRDHVAWWKRLRM